MNKKIIIKSILFYLFVFILSIIMTKVTLFNSHFVFFVPWVFFGFLNNKWWGIVSLIGSFCGLLFINEILCFLFFLICTGILIVRSFLKFSNRNMKPILNFSCFFLVLLCSLLEKFILENNNYLFVFISSILGYWVMFYFYELYFSFKKDENYKFDSRISSFVLVMFGVVFISLDLSIWKIDFSLIILLLLSFMGVKIGLDVGCLYTLIMLLILYFNKGVDVNLYIFGYTFLLISFFKKTTKLTLSFLYVVSVLFVIYYLNSDYFNIINYLIVGIVLLLIPNSFIERICLICYGSESYVEKLVKDNRKFNLDIANRIVKMEEVFSLVCEKIKVKDRIKKNDKKLLLEEINVFDDLLKNFSSEIKENYEFNANYKVEKEFYKYGVDLLRFDFKENLLGNKFIELDVRCEKKEIRNFIVPLVNKIMNTKYDLIRINYNDVFCYYSLKVENKKNINFNYGISQKSLKSEVCGDSYLVYENEKLHMFAISDGMGSGKEARESSKMALELLKRFLDIGLGLSQSLKFLNYTLRGRYSKEFYSTLDLFVYDKIKDSFYFCKNGASDSYLFKNNKEIIRGNKLPLGIVEKIDFEFSEVKLNKGDFIVMASDGVCDVDIIGFELLKGKKCQRISDIIVNKGEVIKDDKTVFVIKVC